MIRHHLYPRSSGAVMWCIAAVIGACLLLQCGVVPLAGGASEETNARVMGMVIDSAGNAAPYASVQMIPSHFNPLAQTSTPDFPSDTTDENGRYEIGHVDSGSYTLEAVDLQKQTKALIGDIIVTGDSVTVPQATLRKPGTLKVMLPIGVDPINGYVFISGTTFGASLNGNTSSVILDAVPAGIVPPLFYGVRNNAAEPRLLRDNITILPGKLVTIYYAGWKSLKKLTLNTTASGADVAGTITDFPVLVRLTSANFPFHQAKSDGSDLRFAKSDGTPLPFEIERWDFGAERAAIWVRLDTVYGNDGSHSLFLYWGNPNAATASNSAAVFDTTRGFQGVWHLADNSADPTVKDATGKNDGVMKSGSSVINTSSVSIDGMISGAMGLQGIAQMQWIDLGANKPFLNGKQQITISLWMNAESDAEGNKELFCFSKGGTLSTVDPESRASIGIMNNKFFIQARGTDNSGYQSITSANVFVAKQWYNVVVLIKVPQDSMYLFVNGELWNAVSVAFGTQSTDATNSTSSSIGANDNGKDNFFYGIIDEARLETSARSADWIKLSYMNQKEVDALIK